MAGANPNQNPMQLAQQNAALRAALLSSAPRMRKDLGAFTGQAGATTRIKLFNVGVITKLQLDIAATLTIATTVGVPSAKAPYNLIKRLQVTDYDGTNRISVSGFQLYLLNSVRNRSPFGLNNSAAVTAITANPATFTAIGNGIIRFFMDVPLAFDVDNPIVQLQDLRGAILAQTAVGEMYLTIDWVDSLVTPNDDDALYKQATGTVVGNPTTNYITVNVWQEYLLPQAIGANGEIPLPGQDLMTVYELNGNLRSGDNLIVNTEKLINYPNVRSVVGAYVNYASSNLLAFGNVSRIRLIANGNNVLRDNTERSQVFNQRIFMIQDADLIPGCFFMSHRDKPIETALFGNVQFGLTPSVVAGVPYTEIMFESFYTKGAALPGLTQGS